MQTRTGQDAWPPGDGRHRRKLADSVSHQKTVDQRAYHALVVLFAHPRAVSRITGRVERGLRDEVSPILSAGR